MLAGLLQTPLRAEAIRTAQSQSNAAALLSESLMATPLDRDTALRRSQELVWLNEYRLGRRPGHGRRQRTGGRSRSQTLKARHKAMMQESLFQRVEPARAQPRLMLLEMLGVYVIRMQQAAAQSSDPELGQLLRDETQAIRNWFAACFDAAIQAMEHIPPTGPAIWKASGRRRAAMAFLIPLFYA